MTVRTEIDSRRAGERGDTIFEGEMEKTIREGAGTAR